MPRRRCSRLIVAGCGAAFEFPPVNHCPLRPFVSMISTDLTNCLSLSCLVFAARRVSLCSVRSTHPFTACSPFHSHEPTLSMLSFASLSSLLASYSFIHSLSHSSTHLLSREPSDSARLRSSKSAFLRSDWICRNCHFNHRPNTIHSRPPIAFVFQFNRFRYRSPTYASKMFQCISNCK
jgi:hypothetical protein